MRLFRSRLSLRPKVKSPLETVEGIQPLVRDVVRQILLTDEETVACVEALVSKAVAEFDWTENIRAITDSYIRSEIRSLAAQLLDRLMHDEEINRTFRRRIISAMEKREGDSAENASKTT